MHALQSVYELAHEGPSAPQGQGQGTSEECLAVACVGAPLDLQAAMYTGIGRTFLFSLAKASSPSQSFNVARV